ncbi:MAG: hypothetical protein M3297_02660 [Thermoproteota archaeon]|jgi:hypothetical protein|nr:hypothetical protein [Thermoproteota archaeon]
MRVLHITTEYPPVYDGGKADAVAQLVNASISAGMTVGVIHIKELSGRNYRTGTSFCKSNIDELNYILC